MLPTRAFHKPSPLGREAAAQSHGLGNLSDSLLVSQKTQTFPCSHQSTCSLPGPQHCSTPKGWHDCAIPQRRKLRLRERKTSPRSAWTRLVPKPVIPFRQCNFRATLGRLIPPPILRFLLLEVEKEPPSSPGTPVLPSDKAASLGLRTGRQARQMPPSPSHHHFHLPSTSNPGYAVNSPRITDLKIGLDFREMRFSLCPFYRWSHGF